MRASKRAVASLFTCACSLVPVAPASASSERPSLLVLVAIDQLGSVYLERYGSALTGGLARLRRRGAYLPNVVFAHANTETAPGHATITTGTWPNVHGMVANYWYDPATLRRANCVEDPALGRSPRNLEVPGIADALRASTRGRAKTISVGVKDRAAIILGGHRPTAAIWYDAASGRFTSGTWYRAGASGLAPEPAWIAEALRAHGAEQAFGTSWDRAAPELDHSALAGADDVPWETDVPGLGRTFPRKLGSGLAGASDTAWRQVYPTAPPAIDAVFDIATRALDAEKLGRNGTTDMLALAVSTLDYAGHFYGPDSQEALDVLVRIDRALAALIAKVDRDVGARSTVWIVTADHGITPAPERARSMGLRAERVDQGAIAAALDAALAAQARGAKIPPAKVEDINSPRVYLRFAADAGDRTPLRRAAAAALRARPEILEAVAVEDTAALPEPFRTLVARTIHPGREPDVVFLQRPYDVIDPGASSGGGSSHGTPYLYDATVPVIAAGPGVLRGTDRAPYDMTRLAPAIAALLGIAPPPAAFEPPLPIVENQ